MLVFHGMATCGMNDASAEQIDFHEVRSSASVPAITPSSHRPRRQWQRGGTGVLGGAEAGRAHADKSGAAGVVPGRTRRVTACPPGQLRHSGCEMRSSTLTTVRWQRDMRSAQSWHQKERSWSDSQTGFSRVDLCSTGQPGSSDLLFHLCHMHASVPQLPCSVPSCMRHLLDYCRIHAERPSHLHRTVLLLANRPLLICEGGHCVCNDRRSRFPTAGCSS